MKDRFIAMTAAALAVGLSIVACGAAASHTTSGAAASHTTNGAAAAAGGNDSGRAEIEQIVSCYRAHGDPAFPDGVYDPSDGRWHFAVSPDSAPAATQQACQHLFPQTQVSPPVPQAQFQSLVRLAQCLRQHGIPNWPDPNPQGQYPLSSRVPVKTPAGQRAYHACQALFPAGGLDVVAAP